MPHEIDIIGISAQLVPFLLKEYSTSNKPTQADPDGNLTDGQRLYSFLRQLQPGSMAKRRLADVVSDYSRGVQVDEEEPARPGGHRRRTRNYLAVLWLLDNLLNGRWPTGHKSFETITQVGLNPVVGSEFGRLFDQVKDLRGPHESSLVDQIAWVDQNLLLEYDDIDASTCPSLGSLSQLRFAKGHEIEWRKMYDVKRLGTKQDMAQDFMAGDTEGAIARLKL